MACFIVPIAEAVVMTVVSKTVKSREAKLAKSGDNFTDEKHNSKAGISFSQKLKWLTSMLWGGSALMAFEHVWHGEITPWFPFLTAAGNYAECSAMLHEMATVGVAMSALVTAVWGVMLLISSTLEKKTMDHDFSAGSEANT